MHPRLPSLLGLLWLAAPAAHAVPTTVVHDDTAPCDVLSVPPALHELGEAPAFSSFPTELIAAVATFTPVSACPSTDGPALNSLVLITNLTGLTWSDLWYVGDPPGATGGGGTSFTNVDGIVNGGLAFKIDTVGLNTPLVAESIAADGIFVPGEVWTFIIDDYVNSVPLPPDALDSIGVGSFSAGGPPSSGSIIAVLGHDVPEPAGLGLLGAALIQLLRRRRRRSGSLALLIASAALAAAPVARAVPTQVGHEDLANCDPLSVPQNVHELGESPAFDNYPSERIRAAATFTENVACLGPNENPSLPNAIVQITNDTGIAWTDLWYVGDTGTAAGGGGTTFANFDGLVNAGLAFKIDTVGVNRPLFSESILADGIFAPTESWLFIIDDYVNSLGLPPDALDSIGVGFGSAGPPSSGSIIAVRVPEPAWLGLAGAYAAALALRRRNQR